MATTYGTFVCADCENEFPKTAKRQWRCKPCGAAHEKRRNIEYLRAMRAKRGARKVGATAPCERCGEPYTYRAGPQKYCPACRLKMNSEQAYTSFKRRPPDEQRAARSKHRDSSIFDGNRAEALERDGRACQRCGSTEDLHVHHIDGLGTVVPKEDRNNSLDNLQTLCRACHTRTHNEVRFG